MMLIESLGIFSFIRSPRTIFANHGKPLPVMGPGCSCGPRMSEGFMMHSRGDASARAWSTTDPSGARPTASKAFSSMSVLAAGENLPAAFCCSGSLQKVSSLLRASTAAPGGLVLPVLDVKTTAAALACLAAATALSPALTMKSIVLGSCASYPAHMMTPAQPSANRAMTAASAGWGVRVRALRVRVPAVPSASACIHAAFSGSRHVPRTE
mmetsp:Transcript_64891/g.115463  ORF Transcript_64891/g.115463 Transcript_64891/m.115463 type:complete len:211 (+) Transcript_64891:529-1161(+)